MAQSKRIPTDGGTGFVQKPFAALSSEGLPVPAEIPPVDSQSPPTKPARKHRGRVDILRGTASHIVPWAEDERNRLNPRNGLCLNALHDRAFDRHLMWIDA